MIKHHRASCSFLSEDFETHVHAVRLAAGVIQDIEMCFLHRIFTTVFPDRLTAITKLYTI